MVVYYLGVLLCIYRGDFVGIRAFLFGVFYPNEDGIPFDWLYLGSILCDSFYVGDWRSDK